MCGCCGGEGQGSSSAAPPYQGRGQQHALAVHGCIGCRPVTRSSYEWTGFKGRAYINLPNTASVLADSSAPSFLPLLEMSQRHHVHVFKAARAA